MSRVEERAPATFTNTVNFSMSSTNQLSGTGLKLCGYVDNETAFVEDSDSVVSWTQPANTFITNIWLLCTSAPTTAASADLGYEVGTSSSGAQIVNTHADDIIDAGADGTDLAAGGLIGLTILRKTTDATTLAADVTYTTAERSLYFNTTCSAHTVTTAGTMRWIIEYVQFA